MAEVNSGLANRILIGLLVGAVAAVIVLIVGTFVPALLEGARWL